MADGTASLRTAQQALQDGLITDADYEQVKQAFLKAQQFKAGLDAGFITPDDYAEVKSRFLDAFYGLSVSGNSGGGGGSMGNAALMANSLQDSPRSLSSAQGHAPTEAPPSQSPLGMASPQRPQQPMASELAPVSSPAPPPAPAGGGGSNDGGSSIPSNIPSVGGALRKKAQGPQTSMSGIAVSDDAINLFYYMKAKSTYRWAMWGVNSNGSEIVIVDVGAKDSTYQEFVDKLPDNDCRFAVYDYQVTNSEGRIFDKLVFFSWSPDTARIKAKMMYASSKDFLKSHMEGLAVELQVSDKDEISEADIHEHVLSVLTRK